MKGKSGGWQKKRGWSIPDIFYFLLQIHFPPFFFQFFAQWEQYELHQRAPMLLASSWFQTESSNIKWEGKRRGRPRYLFPRLLHWGVTWAGYISHERSLFHTQCFSVQNYLLVSTNFFLPFSLSLFIVDKVTHSCMIPSPSFTALYLAVHLYLAQSFLKCPFPIYYLSLFECATSLGRTWLI